jgi:hypothetical protein
MKIILSNFWANLNYESIYIDVEKWSNQLVGGDDYDSILRGLKNKGII